MTPPEAGAAPRPAVDPARAPTPRFAATLVPAPGVARLRHLQAFLPECARLVRRPWPSGEVDSVAGWGLRPTARRARRLAERRGLPYLALEDGFLRSVGLGEAGAPPISLTVDDLGVHYDARGPSRLERMLADGGWDDPALLARAERALAQLIDSGLSKTNAAPPLPAGALPRTLRRRVLVVDQTEGDASVAAGLADADSFRRMLHAALTEEDGAEVVVRRHPAASAGLKRPCLTDLTSGVTVLEADCAAADLLARVDAVYTVTSLLGFEALIRGLPVRTFGTPFYAGWGATRDEAQPLRRGRRRSVLELFACAYLAYARYVDPLTGEPCGIETAIERLAAFRAVGERHACYTACIGFDPWKRAATRAALHSPRGETAFFASPDAAARAAAARGGRVVVWAGREEPETATACEAAGAPLLRMEDGFVRSRGLGSAFHRAGSLTLDDLGVHYDPSRPSRLETMLAETAFTPELLARAAALRAEIVRLRITKYNLGGAETAGAAPGRPTLLVVGQVENDRSLLLGGGAVRTNLGLLAAARRDHPDARLLYKPHPDVEAGHRPGRIALAEALRHADTVLDGADMATALDRSDGVVTMTSGAGFEALLRGKAVFTYGGPFYAGWGLTTDAMTFPRRMRRLGLDQLVAGALILYPLYFDPRKSLPCPPEHLVRLLAKPASAERFGRRWRHLRGAWESLRPALGALY